MSEPLAQLDQQILDGEKLLGHLRNLADEATDKDEKRQLRAEIRLIEPDIKYMSHRRSALLTQWWSQIAGVPMSAYDESVATNLMAQRFRDLWIARNGDAA